MTDPALVRGSDMVIGFEWDNLAAVVSSLAIVTAAAGLAYGHVVKTRPGPHMCSMAETTISRGNDMTGLFVITVAIDTTGGDTGVIEKRVCPRDSAVTFIALSCGG